jgi:D-threo-aldose 1-dehydrogenase
VSKPERVKQTLDWAHYPIPEAVWEELEAVPFSTDDPEATREYRPG